MCVCGGGGLWSPWPIGFGEAGEFATPEAVAAELATWPKRPDGSWAIDKLTERWGLAGLNDP